MDWTAIRVRAMLWVCISPMSNKKCFNFIYYADAVAYADDNAFILSLTLTCPTAKAY